MTLVVRGMRQINIFVFSMGFIPALKIEASGGSQARKRKARRGKYAEAYLIKGCCRNSNTLMI